jgi:hypothetical protein
VLTVITVSGGTGGTLSLKSLIGSPMSLVFG